MSRVRLLIRDRGATDRGASIDLDRDYFQPAHLYLGETGGSPDRVAMQASDNGDVATLNQHAPADCKRSVNVPSRLEVDEGENEIVAISLPSSMRVIEASADEGRDHGGPDDGGKAGSDDGADHADSGADDREDEDILVDEETENGEADGEDSAEGDGPESDDRPSRATGQLLRVMGTAPTRPTEQTPSAMVTNRRTRTGTWH